MVVDYKIITESEEIIYLHCDTFIVINDLVSFAVTQSESHVYYTCLHI